MTFEVALSEGHCPRTGLTGRRPDHVVPVDRVHPPRPPGKVPPAMPGGGFAAIVVHRQGATPRPGGRRLVVNDRSRSTGCGNPRTAPAAGQPGRSAVPPPAGSGWRPAPTI